MQGDVRQKWRQDSALGCTRLRGEEVSTIHHARLQPLFDDVSQKWEGVDLGQQSLVVDAVEAFRNITPA
jgi:hypothetical protein